MNKKLKNNINNNQPISFWGIGPVFGLFSVIISGTAAYLSIKYSNIFRFSSLFILCLTTGIILIGFGLYLWIGQGRKIGTYIKNNILATQGGYGIVRNPIYSGILFVMTGSFLCIQSWLLLSTIPINYIILKLLLHKEDKILANKFGDQYKLYKKSVNSIIPKLISFYKAFFYPVHTKKINKRLYAIKDKDVNFYIYRTNKSYICFDTGYGSSNIHNKLKKLNIIPKDIKHVFLTHTDHDHAKGLKIFNECNLYFHKNEEVLINRKVKRLKPFYFNPPINIKYKLLEDNEHLVIDDTNIYTINSSGHTLGHVAYLINSDILITGDSIIIQNGEIKPFYRIINMKHKQTKLSAEKLKKIGKNKLICTAHTGVKKIKI